MSNLQQLSGPFPLIDIEYVRMERETFQARFVIKTEEALEVEPFWLNEDLFSEFIRFWFIISLKGRTPTVPLDVAKYVNPITRARLNDYPMQMMVHGRKGVAYESYSLKDLKERFKVDSDVQSTLGLQTLNKNEILFEIEFSLRDMIQGSGVHFTKFDDDDIDEVELVTFSHLDVKEMESQFGVNPNLYSSLTEIGGNLVRLPLIRRDEVGVYAKLQIATPIQSLFDSETGELYEGEYHYHSADPPIPNNTNPAKGPLGPGPNGYVGYMSGPPGHPMGDAKILTVRNIPNNKVTANFLVDTDAPWGFDWSSEAYYQNDFIGGTPPSYRSSIVQDPSTREPSQLSKQEKADLLLKAIKKRTKKNVFSEVFTFTNLATSRVYQSTNFTINMDEVLKKDPYYGFYERLVGSEDTKSIYERLESLESLVSQTITSAVAAADYSRAIAITPETIKGFINNLMEYYQVRIYRRRLQNQPTSNNILSTKDREKRSTQEIDKLIGLGSMFGRILGEPRLFFPVYTPGVSIGNLTVDSISPTKRELEIRIADYELISEINYGTYTYLVEMEVNSGLKGFITQLVNAFTKRIQRVQGILHNYAGLKENYTESIDRYKIGFRNSEVFQQLGINAGEMIDLYVVLSTLMFYSETNNISKSFVVDIKKRMYATTNTSSLKRSYEFLDRCIQLESVYRDFLAKNRDSALSTQNAKQLSTDTTMFTAKTSGVSRSFPEFYTSFSQQLPSGFFLEAIPDGQLILDAGLEDLFNFGLTASAGDLEIETAITQASESGASEFESPDQADRPFPVIPEADDGPGGGGY